MRHQMRRSDFYHRLSPRKSTVPRTRYTGASLESKMPARGPLLDTVPENASLLNAVRRKHESRDGCGRELEYCILSCAMARCGLGRGEQIVFHHSFKTHLHRGFVGLYPYKDDGLKVFLRF